MVYGLADIARASLFPHRYRSPHLRARLNDAEALESERAAGGASSGGPRRTDVGTLRRSEFWALRDVSFELRRGECLGLIGPNGAGKSTLFSILSGIYEPTRGRAVIRGRLQALIALGAGFHPMLSGRENIYVNAAVFGLTSREIDRLVDRIIEFSELGEFIDAPIKTYSSGMLVRLGFSVAAHLDPDILLVDEVLAVGDARFQLKCLDHMRRLINSGKAQMLVSHYMHNIQGLCDRVIWLEQGQIKAEGPADEVTRRYTEFMYRAGDDDRAAEPCAISGYPALICGVEVERPEPRGEGGQATGRLRVRVDVQALRQITGARMYLVLRRAVDNLALASASMLEDGHSIDIVPGDNRIEVEILDFPFVAGEYRFYANLRSEDGTVCLSAGGMSPIFRWDGAGPGCLDGTGALRRVAGITDAAVALRYRWQPQGKVI